MPVFISDPGRLDSAHARLVTDSTREACKDMFWEGQIESSGVWDPI